MRGSGEVRESKEKLRKWRVNVYILSKERKFVKESRGRSSERK